MSDARCGFGGVLVRCQDTPTFSTDDDRWLCSRHRQMARALAFDEELSRQEAR